MITVSSWPYSRTGFNAQAVKKVQVHNTRSFKRDKCLLYKERNKIYHLHFHLSKLQDNTSLGCSAIWLKYGIITARIHKCYFRHYGDERTLSLCTVYCFLFAVKKLHGCKSFPSFPEKYSQLQSILPIMAKFEHSKLKFCLKTFAVTK